MPSRPCRGGQNPLIWLLAEAGMEVSVTQIYLYIDIDLYTGIIVHDIATRTKILHVEAAHKGKVSGVCFADENRLLSCGVDRNVQLWDTREVDENGAGPSEV